MDRIYSMLGLATKAGKTKSGLFLTQDAIQSRRARLVIVALDAEKNTVRTLTNKCRSSDVPLRAYGSKESLGGSMGKELRSCVAVTDEGFARNLLKLLDADQADAYMRERGSDGAE